MMPSRRSVLAGAGGLLFAGLAAPAPALARHHRVMLGEFEVIVVSDGGLSLPIGFVLPETPRAETDALFAANGLDPARLQS